MVEERIVIAPRPFGQLLAALGLGHLVVSTGVKPQSR